MQAGKALVRQCAGSSVHLVLAKLISTKILRDGPYVCNQALNKVDIVRRNQWISDYLTTFSDSIRIRITTH